MADITPLPKKAAEYVGENYRPISPTSVVCKVCVIILVSVQRVSVADKLAMFSCFSDLLKAHSSKKCIIKLKEGIYGHLK